jgi:CheY-like chemotaxis protein
MEKSKKVLVAEDNPKDAELMFLALEGANLDIVHVRDGSEVMDYLYCGGEFSQREPGNPAVIFLDIKMPKLSGLQVLKLIRADNKLKTIPVVIVTSSKEDSDVVEGYSLGVNAYVVKPVTFEKFIKTIKQIGVFWTLINETPM